MIDTHNHLYFDKFDADRADVLARMAEAGVVGGVVIGIDPQTIAQARELARVGELGAFAVRAGVALVLAEPVVHRPAAPAASARFACHRVLREV